MFDIQRAIAIFTTFSKNFASIRPFSLSYNTCPTFTRLAQHIAQALAWIFILSWDFPTQNLLVNYDFFMYEYGALFWSKIKNVWKWNKEKYWSCYKLISINCIDEINDGKKTVIRLTLALEWSSGTPYS